MIDAHELEVQRSLLELPHMQIDAVIALSEHTYTTQVQEELHVLSVKLVINFKVENVSLIIRHASQDANSALEVQEYKTRQL